MPSWAAAAAIGGARGGDAALCGSDKMAAPRRPRGEKEQDEDDLLLEAKRVRGQRRLLVVLEGASLETVKVRTEGVGPGDAPRFLLSNCLCFGLRWERRSNSLIATSIRRCCCGAAGTPERCGPTSPTRYRLGTSSMDCPRACGAMPVWHSLQENAPGVWGIVLWPWGGNEVSFTHHTCT